MDRQAFKQRIRYRIESLYELAKNYAQIEWRYIEFR